MAPYLLKTTVIILALCACSSPKSTYQSSSSTILAHEEYEQPSIAGNDTAVSLTTLPQTQFGGFVLKPGLYEGEFKTYCLQPGTPDPHQGDAYVQGPMFGHRKEIIESILKNSLQHPNMEQRNIQLLLWSVVSSSDYNKLSAGVQMDAAQLLSSRQIYELKGGFAGMVKSFAHSSGLLNVNSDMRRLFESGMNTYEAYEKIAVRNEQATIVRRDVKADQWYKQEGGYFVRYFPESYKKIKVQVFVPQSVLPSAQNAPIVFDPTAQQAIPAFTNAQRLGVGAPVVKVIREIIKVKTSPTPPPIKTPVRKKKKVKEPSTGVEV